MQVTNALLKTLDEAISRTVADEQRAASFKWIEDVHAQLARDMHLSDEDYEPVREQLAVLQRLLEGAKLTQEASPRLRARIAAHGELLSSQLGIAFFRNKHLNAKRVDSRELLVSDVGRWKSVSEADAYLEADVRPTVNVEKAEAAAGSADVVLCQGFIAATPDGSTCLLGRGGSDTSGALFAALCGAVRVEIWTDVNGMFTSDPRYVPKARLIRHLTYREAQELAAMGAKVLHPRCLVPAAFAGIPVEVRNTMDPCEDAELTVVSTGKAYTRVESKPALPESEVLSDVESEHTDGGNQTTVGGAGASSEPPSSATNPHSTSVMASPGSRIVFTASPWYRNPSCGELSSLSLGASAHSHTLAHGAVVIKGVEHEAPVVPFNPTDLNLTLTGGGDCKILAVSRRKGVTLLNMSSFAMWGNSGFLARIFEPFGAHGISVDLIATSQYAVSVTLDHIPDGVYGETFRKLLASLGKHCTTTVRYPCAVVSVVGRSLRTALDKIGAAMSSLSGVCVYMVSEASEDLNMSYVVDEDVADKLVTAFHAALLENDDISKDTQFGPTWGELPCGATPTP